MELREYIEKNGGQTAFARRLGVSQGLVWQWLNGRTRITPDKAKEIEDMTGGACTRIELLYGDEARQ